MPQNRRNNSRPRARKTKRVQKKFERPLSEQEFFPPIGRTPRWWDFEGVTGILMNTRMRVRLPLRLPAFDDALPGEYLDPGKVNPPPDLSYDPNRPSKIYMQNVVYDLWEGVCEAEPWMTTRDFRKLRQLCMTFDHVDFYRLVYITLVHQSSVFTEDESLFSRFAEILKKAGRPKAYRQTLLTRYKSRTDQWNYKAKEISDLFRILRNTSFVGRDKAFRRLIFWVQRRAKLSVNVLDGLPEAILAIENESQKEGNDPYELKWDCCPRSFMYKDVSGSPTED
jgi:hypothetical protein